MVKINKGYNASTKINQNKIYANQMYQRSIEGNYKGKHLFLESENCLTIKHLQQLNIAEENMYIINDDLNVCDQIKQNNNKINIFCQTTTQFFSQTNCVFESIWLDYMCSIYGNENFRPHNDLDLIFSKKLLQNNASLGLTFSFRQAKINWRLHPFRKHKLTHEKIINSATYGVLQKYLCDSNKLQNRWINNVINLVEYLRIKYCDIYDIKVFEYYKYQGQKILNNNDKNIRANMYVFFIKVFLK